MNYCKDCKHRKITPHDDETMWYCDLHTKTNITKSEDPLTGVRIHKTVKYKYCASLRHPMPGKIIEDCPDYRPNIKKRIKTWLTGKP